MQATSNKNVINDIYFKLDETDREVVKKSSIIVRSSESNQNFTATDAGNEATDNTFDASNVDGDGHIQGESHVLLLEEKQDMLSNDHQFSMILTDACGGFNLREAFSPDKEIVYYKEIYKNYDMLIRKMGAYNTGLKSYTNIGTDVMIATKQPDGTWQVLWLNRIPGARAYGSNLAAETSSGYNFQYYTVENLIGHLSLDVHQLKENADTIIYIKNISNDINEKGDKRISNMIQLVDYFKYKKGIAYSDLLKNGFKITVNGEQVVPISPFEFPDAPHLIQPFFYEQITLREFCKTQKYLKEELWDLYGHLFDTMDQMLDEKMELTLYHIDKAGVKKRYSDRNKYKYNIILTNTDTSGLYINRNGKYIGKPVKIEGLFTGHPGYNGFRAEAKISPLFDKIFGIGSNKNNHILTSNFSEVLRELLCKKNIIRDKEQLQAYLKTLPTEVQSPEKQLERQIAATKKNQLQLDAIVSKAKLMGIDTKITPTNTPDITQSNVLTIDGKINEQLKKITSIVERKNKEVVEESDKLVQRATRAIKNRKALIRIFDSIEEERGFYETALLEPKNEGELYGLLEKAMVLVPHKFTFKILDYNEKSGLDSVILHEDANEYKALNMEQRIQPTNELSTKFPTVAFCEYKYVLVDQQNINHSLAVVSCLVCWNMEESVKTIVAQDGIYSLVVDEANNLIFKANPQEYGGPEKIVKLILLQPLLEEAYGVEFESYSNVLDEL